MDAANLVGQRARELCASPTGCTFLLLAEAAMLPPNAVAEPVVAVQLAAKAISETISFRNWHRWLVPAAIAEGPRLISFAREVLAQPAAEWWFAPLDRDAQEWIGAKGLSPPTLVGEVERDLAPSKGELYGQEPIGGALTSTGVGRMSKHVEALVYDDDYVWRFGDTPPHPLERPRWNRSTAQNQGVDIPAAFGEFSSAVAALLYQTGDYSEGPPPLARYRLRAASDLRVFEVEGPQSWHELCVQYPAFYKERLVPDWTAFAKEWDAIHLTLGGLLTADQVRVESAAGWTKLELWEFEHTCWMRWRFDAIEPMPDLTNFRLTPFIFPTPQALTLPPGVGRQITLVRKS